MVTLSASDKICAEFQRSMGCTNSAESCRYKHVKMRELHKDMAARLYLRNAMSNISVDDITECIRRDFAGNEPFFVYKNESKWIAHVVLKSWDVAQKIIDAGQIRITNASYLAYITLPVTVPPAGFQPWTDDSWMRVKHAQASGSPLNMLPVFQPAGYVPIQPTNGQIPPINGPPIPLNKMGPAHPLPVGPGPAPPSGPKGPAAAGAIRPPPGIAKGEVRPRVTNEQLMGEVEALKKTLEERKTADKKSTSSSSKDKSKLGPGGLAKLKSQHTNELIALQIGHVSTLVTLKKSHAKELSRVKAQADLRGRLAKADSGHAECARKLLENEKLHETVLKELKAGYEDKLKTAASKIKMDRQILKADHQRDLAALRKKLATVATETDEKIEGIKEEERRRVQAAKSEFRRQLGAVKKKLEDKGKEYSEINVENSKLRKQNKILHDRIDQGNSVLRHDNSILRAECDQLRKELMEQRSILASSSPLPLTSSGISPSTRPRARRTTKRPVASTAITPVVSTGITPIASTGITPVAKRRRREGTTQLNSPPKVQPSLLRPRLSRPKPTAIISLGSRKVLSVRDQAPHSVYPGDQTGNRVYSGDQRNPMTNAQSTFSSSTTSESALPAVHTAHGSIRTSNTVYSGRPAPVMAQRSDHPASGTARRSARPASEPVCRPRVEWDQAGDTSFSVGSNTAVPSHFISNSTSNLTESRQSDIQDTSGRPVPAQPVPTQHITSQPVPAQPVQAQPVPTQHVPVQPAPTQPVPASTQRSVVEYIVGHARVHGDLWYKLKFVGEALSDQDWTPETGLSGADALIAKYWENPVEINPQ
eukprot:266154_1